MLIFTLADSDKMIVMCNAANVSFVPRVNRCIENTIVVSTAGGILHLNLGNTLLISIRRPFRLS